MNLHPSTRLFGRPRRSLGLALLAFAASLGAGPATSQPGRPSADTNLVAPSAQADGAQTTSLSLAQLGQREPLLLRALDGGHNVRFSVRADEVVTRLSLRLQLGFATELPLQRAQLEVAVNDEVIARLPIERDASQAQMVRDVDVDPRLLTDHNRIRLQLVLPRAVVCERLDRERLWARLDPTSLVAMTVQPLPVAADLALLPAPFFDRRDNRRLDLSFVLPAQPAPGVLQAAGVLASWFGAQASYRGATVHTSVGGSLPTKGHSIVLATAQQGVPGLSLPPISGPTVSVIEHPGRPQARLLLVVGRDIDELKWAANALTLGQLALKGSTVLAGPPRALPARQPYDAPNWLPTDRPVRFDALVPAERLQGRGPHPAPLAVEMRLPPDLYFARQDSVPVQLQWHFTPPLQDDRSAAHLSFNGAAVRSFPIQAERRWSLPDGIAKRSEGSQQVHVARVRVPGGLVGRVPVSQLGVRFDYDAPVDDPCSTASADGQQRSGVDGSSTIDFSGVPHFIGLPDLAAFANSGYPFSRMADLSDTAVLLPTAPDVDEIDAYLTLMAMFGRSTGYPALGVRVGHAGDLASVSDRDLVLIGTAARQPLLRQWAEHLPLALDGAGASGPGPAGSSASDGWRRWVGWVPGLGGPQRLSYRSADGGAALLGFESPLTQGRSVIALTATTAARLRAVGDALTDPAQVSRTRGSVTLIEADGLRSLEDGPTYHVGDVGLFNRLRYTLAWHPLVLTVLTLLVAVALAWGSAHALRRVARRRLAAAIDPLTS